MLDQRWLIDSFTKLQRCKVNGGHKGFDHPINYRKQYFLINLALIYKRLIKLSRLTRAKYYL